MSRSEVSGTRACANRGLTLFEVMAAVAVMGLVYTLLAQAAIQGIRAEGENQRRLEASLLADQFITDVEDMIASGDAPPVGRSEEEDDPFLVTLSVEELDMKTLLAPVDRATDREESAVFETGDGPGRFRSVVIEVSWLEAGYDRVIRRTTYAFDSTGLETLLAAAGAGEIPPGADELGAAGTGGGAARGVEGLNKTQRLLRQLEVTGKLDAWWKKRGGKLQ